VWRHEQINFGFNNFRFQILIDNQKRRLHTKFDEDLLKSSWDMAIWIYNFPIQITVFSAGFITYLACEKQPRIPCVSPRLPPLTPPPEIAKLYYDFWNYSHFRFPLSTTVLSCGMLINDVISICAYAENMLITFKYLLQSL
jgi:hypothetical protein